MLGPFASFGYSDEPLPSRSRDAAGAVTNDLPAETTELMRRSALVILQIDNRLTEAFLAQMRKTLPTLRPNQVLVYFSRKIETPKLNEAYQKFVSRTRDFFPAVLPSSIESNRFIAFDDGWQPFLCGSLTLSKFSWGKLLPLLGHRLEAARTSRLIARILRPFFERRNLVNSQRKLYGDGAIGVSGFFLLDYGLPAGVMMLRNFWIMHRRWVAVLALFVAPVVILVSHIVAFIFLALSGDLGLALDAAAFMTLVVIGSPIMTYWLWRRLSGREIRQHIAFGGDTQPLWKVILVILLTGGWFLGSVVLVLVYSIFNL